MVNMTMAIPEQLHKIIKKHPEIKWTEVARQAIEKKAKLLEAEKDPWRIYAYKRWAEEYEHQLLEPELRPEYVDKLRKIGKEKSLKVKDVNTYFEKLKKS